MMQALRWHGVRDVRLDTVPLPDPAPDQAVIAVLWVGLCGSDLEEYLVGPIVISPPVTLGHEIVGRVHRASADGSGPAEGTVVVVDVVTGCGHCFWCLDHNEGLCPELAVTGFDVDGGLAQFVAARASRLIPVPDSFDPRLAALAEPTAVAVRAARKIAPVGGRGAVVVGGGTIGLLVAQLLSAQGASPVVIVEPNASRRAVAASLGLTAVWEPTAANRMATLAGLFPERGIDVVVECSGADGASGEAIDLVRRGGTVLLLSVTAHDQAVSTTDIVLAEKTVMGSAAHMWDVDVAPAVALLASGAIDVRSLITHTFSLADGAAAFHLLADPAGDSLKILITTEGSS